MNVYACSCYVIHNNRFCESAVRWPRRCCEVLLKKKTFRFYENRKYTINKLRTNIAVDHVRHGGKTYLQKGVLSNTISEGPIVDLVREILGVPITHLCLNKNVLAQPHTDSRNNGPSYILFTGDYSAGGHLNFENSDIL